MKHLLVKPKKSNHQEIKIRAYFWDCFWNSCWTCSSNCGDTCNLVCSYSFLW